MSALSYWAGLNGKKNNTLEHDSKIEKIVLGYIDKYFHKLRGFLGGPL